METLNKTVGLNQEYKIDVANKLNTLLADFQVYYMNLRGLHWNVKGRNFFFLHETLLLSNKSTLQIQVEYFKLTPALFYSNKSCFFFLINL